MYQLCIFISHSWLHVTLELQPIYFTLGALCGSFQGPIKVCAAKQIWSVIFTQTLLLLSASSFFSLPPLPHFSFNSHLPPSPICVFRPLFIPDSETTEDETTEPQMETKGGPGRHQDKTGGRGPSGNPPKIFILINLHIIRSANSLPGDDTVNQEKKGVCEFSPQMFSSSEPLFMSG